MSAPLRPFRLLRWFSVVSFAAITAFSALSGIVVSRFVADTVLDRDAQLTAGFIQATAEAEARHHGLDSMFSAGRLDDGAGMSDPAEGPSTRNARVHAEFYAHLARLPDVVLAVAYAPDGRVLWSNRSELVDAHLTDNDSLRTAVREKRAVTRSFSATSVSAQRRHAFLDASEPYFVETYVPLLDGEGRVAAVVEIYKEPRSLHDAIVSGRALVWTSTLAGAVFLYLALYWLVRRAERVMREQQRRIVETENLVLVGEMTAAVAHGIRNPLAAMRSSAELAFDSQGTYLRKNLGDIIVQIDRLGRWVSDMVVLSTSLNSLSRESVDLREVLAESCRTFAEQCERVGIRIEHRTGGEGELPLVAGNRTIILHVLHSVLSNAVEAMPRGGVLSTACDALDGGRKVRLSVEDSGPGMSAEQLRLLEPLHSTKRNGLGVGLSLSRRIMYRLGGRLALITGSGRGLRVELLFMGEGAK